MKGIRRWQVAQNREAAFRGISDGKGACDIDKLMQSINLMRVSMSNLMSTRQLYIEDRVGVQPTGLLEMCVLEIGGPLFVDRDLFEVKTRRKILLDPLPWIIISDDVKWLKGVGEFIPLKSNSVHLCWIENTIDHCSDPPLVLREIRRILTDSGRLVIGCNVFTSWTRPFFPIFNRLDGPHPWHFTKLSLIKMLRDAGFDCEVEFPILKPSIRRRERLVSRLKVLLGQIAGLKCIYLRCIQIQ